IGYQRDRKPILLTCCRKGSAQDEIFKQDTEGLLAFVDAHRELDSWRVSDHLRACRFFIASILDKNDINDEGYDFNGWILQFFEGACSSVDRTSPTRAVGHRLKSCHAHRSPSRRASFRCFGS